MSGQSRCTPNITRPLSLKAFSLIKVSSTITLPTFFPLTTTYNLIHRQEKQSKNKGVNSGSNSIQ